MKTQKAKINPFANQSTLEDIKRFEKKVYIFCGVGLLTGILIFERTWNKHSALALILEIIAIALAIISLIMIGFFLNFFYKVKKRMREESERGDNHSI